MNITTMAAMRIHGRDTGRIGSEASEVANGPNRNPLNAAAMMAAIFRMRTLSVVAP